MTPSVYLNGRFLTQSLTGVQRFSAEITAAIDRLITAGRWPETVILAPRPSGAGSNVRTCDYQRLKLEETGRTRGHVWEQIELPVAARGGILVNLGNTAPVLARSRQIVVIHDAGVFDVPESYSLRFRAWYRALHHGLVRTGARIVTVSHFSRQRIADRLGLDPGSIAVIHEGADHILRVSADATVLQRHGLRARQFALVVGSLAAHKNLAALSEAAEAFERRGFVVAIAGGRNRAIFSDSRTASCLRQLGRVTDAELRALYENAACLLFPSGYEGFGLPPVEAMICGCPVLASGGGAVEEICGDAVVYFDIHQKDSMIAAFDRLLDDPVVACELRRRGHARAASLNWEASAFSLGEVVRSVRS
jgi:glycosyltransferase involved in cell wall biosynthesis